METENQVQRPVIGISTFNTLLNERTYSKISHYYAQCIRRTGGLPFLIPIHRDTGLALDYAARLDGLLLTGGAEDVSPLFYGEEPHPSLNNISPPRDAWEFSLINAALDGGLPILGICRGAQVLNVALGGSLYQSVKDQVENALGHGPKKTQAHHLFHTVRLERGSRLHGMFGSEKIAVNSFHHQAVKRLAKGCKAAAFASDGVIEAFEAENKRFVIGVQWHPEALCREHGEFLKIFESLVQAARD
jgi:putative glutamine amidotransferase